MQPAYRRDVDGLRALAVVPVVLFHAFPSILPGGFVGVDVFFVISGFLISTIIFGAVDRGDFSYADFYRRRVRRIFPALGVVLTATLVVGWFVLLPDDLASLGKHTAGAVAFVANLVSWREAGYFDVASESKPLLHLWSLGIEEQFYIVFPPLVLLATRLRIPRSVLLGVGLVGSFAACVVGTELRPGAAFSLPVTRAWELLVGAVLADVALRGGLARLADRRRLADGLGIVGVLAVVGAVLTFDGAQPFPGWRAGIPVLGTAAVLAAGPGAFANRALLGRRALVAIGLISYPLYLWHWPFLVVPRLATGAAPGVAARLALVAGAVVAAVLTFRFVERPLRFSTRLPRPAIVLSAALACVGVAGLGVRAAEGVPDRYPAPLADLARYDVDYLTDALVGSCWLDNDDPVDGFAPACLPAGNGPLVVVWGDSHAARLTPGLRAVAPELRVGQMTRNSCPPVLDVEYERCRASNAAVLTVLRAVHPDRVVLHAAWNDYPYVDRVDRVADQLAVTLTALRDAGIDDVVVVGPSPRWSGALPDLLLRAALRADATGFPERTANGWRRDAAALDAVLGARVAGIDGVSYVSALDVFCDAAGCRTSVDGTAAGLVTFDDGHLSTPGATFLARAMVAGW
jgi:peptidoglycan/LPS O-acetylase OafA/YrhL